MTRRLVRGATGLAIGALLAGCAASGTGDRQRVLELNRQALQARMEDNAEDARAAYAALVEIDPERPRAWFELGNLRAQAGELDGAREALENALEYDPLYHEARYNLGLVYMRLGADHLGRARDAMPEDDNTLKTDIYLACLLGQVIRNPEIAIPCPELP